MTVGMRSRQPVTIETVSRDKQVSFNAEVGSRPQATPGGPGRADRHLKPRSKKAQPGILFASAIRFAIVVVQVPWLVSNTKSKSSWFLWST